MTINPADFPLYDLLVKLNQPGVENLMADMTKAQSGDLNDAYQVALGLYQVANIPNIEAHIPGLTRESKTATLAKCAEVFQTAAAGGNEGAKAMVEYINNTKGPSGPALG